MRKVYEIWVTGSENDDPVNVYEAGEGDQPGELGRQTLIEEIGHHTAYWLDQGVYSVETCVRWDKPELEG